MYIIKKTFRLYDNELMTIRRFIDGSFNSMYDKMFVAWREKHIGKYKIICSVREDWNRCWAFHCELEVADGDLDKGLETI